MVDMWASSLNLSPQEIDGLSLARFQSVVEGFKQSNGLNDGLKSPSISETEAMIRAVQSVN